LISSEDIWRVLRPRLRRFIADTGDIGLIKQYTDCESATIGGWLAETMPLADKLIRVWHLLDALGYESPEMGALDALQRYLGRIYTFGVIDMERLRELLIVANQQDAIFFLRGRPSLRLGLKDLPELKQKHDARLNEIIAGLPKIAEGQPDSQPAAEHAVVVHEGMDKVLLLATLIGAALPLARDLVESGTPAQRSALRKVTGSPTLPTIFALSNYMGALCGESARDQLLRGGSGKA